MGSVAAKNAFVSLLAGLTGVRKAPENPPDSLNHFPFAVAWVREYTYKQNRAGQLFPSGSHVLVGQIHVARKNLPVDLATIEVYPDLVRTALEADPTLGGTIRRIESYEAKILPGQWDTQNTLYVEFLVGIDVDYC
jgi:hypothetical protein